MRKKILKLPVIIGLLAFLASIGHAETKKTTQLGKEAVIKESGKMMTVIPLSDAFNWTFRPLVATSPEGPQGDTVIILFEAQATMIDGDIYRNSYSHPTVRIPKIK